MLDKEIYSYVNTQANLIANLAAKQRGIDIDQSKNWSYKDGAGIFHVCANQKYWNGTSWVYEDNTLNSITLTGSIADRVIVTDANKKLVSHACTSAYLTLLTSAGDASTLHNHTSLYSVLGHPHTASNITDFNAVGDARWSPLGDTRWSPVGHPHTASNITDFNAVGDARWSPLGNYQPLENQRLSTSNNVTFGSGTFTGDVTLQAASANPVLHIKNNINTLYTSYMWNMVRTTSGDLWLGTEYNNDVIFIVNNAEVARLTTDVEKRFRIKGRLSLEATTASPGLWIKDSGAVEIGFVGADVIGSTDTTNIGLYGSRGAGWGLLMNVKTGDVTIKGELYLQGASLIANRIVVTNNNRTLVSHACTSANLTLLTSAGDASTLHNHATLYSVLGHPHTASNITDFNAVGDARWSPVGNYQPLENQRLSTTNNVTFNKGTFTGGQVRATSANTINGSYLELAKYNGSLPGYVNDAYPVLKTDFTNLYFSVGGQYSGEIFSGVNNNATFSLFNATPATKVYLNTSGPSYFTGGNVGIGTSTPPSRLSIMGNSDNGSVRIIPAIVNYESSIGFYRDLAGTDMTTRWVVGQGGWGNVGKFFIACGTVGPSFVIDTAGKVGIGTSTPRSLLEINGGAGNHPIIILDNTSATRVYTGVSYCRNVTEKFFAGLNNTDDDWGVSLDGSTINRALGIKLDKSAYFNGGLTINGGLTVNADITLGDPGQGIRRGIRGGSVTDNWFVGCADGGANNGYLLIGTGDDGIEPIVVAQYTGQAGTGTLTRMLTLLGVSGETSLPGALSVAGGLQITGNAVLNGNVVPGGMLTVDLTNTNNTTHAFANPSGIGVIILAGTNSTEGYMDFVPATSDTSPNGSMLSIVNTTNANAYIIIRAGVNLYLLSKRHTQLIKYNDLWYLQQ